MNQKYPLFDGLLIALLRMVYVALHAADNSSKSSTPSAAMLGKSLKTRLYAMAPARNMAFDKLNGQADLQRWKDDRRSFFRQQNGEFPKQTPLNARVVGRLQREGYRVEKVMFENRPRNHVTATGSL